jgi:hypothetical protein
MTAIIDNVTWRAVCLAVNTSVTGIISVAGGENTSASTGITIAIAVPRSVGTNTIGVLSPTNVLLTIGGSALWQASPAGGSGTVTVTTSTANSAAGTFSLSMTPQAGTAATGTKSVTNGTFSVTF